MDAMLVCNAFDQQVRFKLLTSRNSHEVYMTAKGEKPPMMPN